MSKVRVPAWWFPTASSPGGRDMGVLWARVPSRRLRLPRLSTSGLGCALLACIWLSSAAPCRLGNFVPLLQTEPRPRP